MKNYTALPIFLTAGAAVLAIAVPGCAHRAQSPSGSLTPAVVAQQRPGRTPPPPGMAQWYQNTMTAKAAAQGHP